MATSKQISTSFKNSVKRGTPVTEAFQSVAKRWKTTPTRVANVVTKEGFCRAYKYRGFTYYWPTFETNNNANWTKQSQYEFVQWAMNWAFSNGWAKPEDFKGKNPWQIWCWLQPKFNAFFKPYKATAKKTTKTRKSTPKTTARKRTTTKSKKSTPKRKAKKSPRTGLKYKGRTYKGKARTTKTRRYRKAA